MNTITPKQGDYYSPIESKSILYKVIRVSSDTVELRRVWDKSGATSEMSTEQFSKRFTWAR